MQTIANTGQKLSSLNEYGYSSRARSYEYYPLIKGNIAPSFALRNEDSIDHNYIEASLANEIVISLQNFLEYQQPLVLAFYAGETNKSNSLKLFESLQAEIQIKGGKLLILTNIPAQHFSKAIRYRHSLNVFYDRNNAIAKSFGLYDPLNPVWQWVPGVEDTETPLPALYVISPDRQITYHHIDYDFSLFNNWNFLGRSFLPELLAAVYQSGQNSTNNPEI